MQATEVISRTIGGRRMSVRLIATEFDISIPSLGTTSGETHKIESAASRETVRPSKLSSPNDSTRSGQPSEKNASTIHRAPDIDPTSIVTVIPSVVEATVVGSESPGVVILETEEVRCKLC